MFLFHRRFLKSLFSRRTQNFSIQKISKKILSDIKGTDIFSCTIFLFRGDHSMFYILPRINLLCILQLKRDRQLRYTSTLPCQTSTFQLFTKIFLVKVVNCFISRSVIHQLLIIFCFLVSPPKVDLIQFIQKIQQVRSKLLSHFEEISSLFFSQNYFKIFTVICKFVRARYLNMRGNKAFVSVILLSSAL